MFPPPFLEKTVLSSLNGLGMLVENQWTVNVGVYSWTVWSSPLACMSAPALVTVASLELLKSGIVNPPALFLFFKIVLVFGSLRCHVTAGPVRRRSWPLAVALSAL